MQSCFFMPDGKGITQMLRVIPLACIWFVLSA